MSEDVKFERCGAVGKCMAHPASYESSAKSPYGYSKPSMKRIAAVAMEALEAARRRDVETHERNIPFMERNKAMRERVVALMTEAGIPRTWSEKKYASSRSRYPKTFTNDAGYIGDMQRNLPIDDGFAAATATYESLLAKYRAYEQEAAGEEERIQKAREETERREREARLANVELAEIILRYGLHRESTWSDVLDELRKKDQRLDLAVAMAQTRGDWSEGPYRVSAALNRFKIETDEDKDIAADVVDCLHDFEDGRVFRDTRWSYGALFGSVADQQLSADVQNAYNHSSD